MSNSLRRVFCKDSLAFVPWAAGLLAAGWYQADLAHSSFGWPWWCAWVFPLAIEAGVAWSAANFHHRLVQRDSTIAARLWLFGLMGFSCSLLFFHANNTGKPVEAAAAISAMTIIAAVVWLQRASSRRRDVMRERGLVYPAVPNFPVYRWMVCPVETGRAFRLGIRLGLDDPLECLRKLRLDQGHMPDRDTKPEQKKSEQVRVSGPALVDADDLQIIEALRSDPAWPDVTLSKVMSIVANSTSNGTCGKSRAIRLRNKALELEAA